ncbi:MAG: protein-L-isoaspartate(D-aspartate) O-methyltransferase [Candidatus Sumerlaeota bacterium]|nr:protein-L-isoaspartate(D-aspartate) O-methyltransferase [Candidatus Sumerlaeota bacterium]
MSLDPFPIPDDSGNGRDRPDAAPIDEAEMAKRRRDMVRVQLLGRDIDSVRVLDAMRVVPRHLFVPRDQVSEAYEDRPLAIGMGQTISQPYIVGLMTQRLRPELTDTVLEIGTGCGYQAAVLAALVREVHTVEIHKRLAESAARRLKALGYNNVHVHAGDGWKGWPSDAPYDGIIVTAAPDHVPEALKEQLKVGARLVIPVGNQYQKLMVVTRTEKGFVEESLIDVRFVPMTGGEDEGA